MSKTKRGYQIDSWRGITRYVCEDCSFDTLHRATIEKHRAGAHPPRFIPEDSVQNEAPDERHAESVAGE